MNHREAWELIPWLVNGSLDDAERGLIEAHLAECALCREELQAQRTLMQSMRSRPQLEAMPPASLQKLWARLDAAPPRGAGVSQAPARSRLPSYSWLVASVAGVALLLGATLLAVVRPLYDAPPAEFRTVSDAPAGVAAGDVRAVFAGEMTLAELQALLLQHGLRVVDGPSSSGVYTLAGTAATIDTEAVLAGLRAHPAVHFAEPAGPGP